MSSEDKAVSAAIASRRLYMRKFSNFIRKWSNLGEIIKKDSGSSSGSFIYNSMQENSIFKIQGSHKTIIVAVCRIRQRILTQALQKWQQSVKVFHDYTDDVRLILSRPLPPDELRTELEIEVLYKWIIQTKDKDPTGVSAIIYNCKNKGTIYNTLQQLRLELYAPGEPIVYQGQNSNIEDGHFTVFSGTCEVLQFSSNNNNEYNLTIRQFNKYIKDKKFDEINRLLLEKAQIVAILPSYSGFGELISLTGGKRPSTIRASPLRKSEIENSRSPILNNEHLREDGVVEMLVIPKENLIQCIENKYSEGQNLNSTKSVSESIDFLRQSGLAQNLNSKELMKIASNLKKRVIRQGEILFYKGQEVKCFYLIVYGDIILDISELSELKNYFFLSNNCEKKKKSEVQNTPSTTNIPTNTSPKFNRNSSSNTLLSSGSGKNKGIRSSISNSQLNIAPSTNQNEDDDEDSSEDPNLKEIKKDKKRNEIIAEIRNKMKNGPNKPIIIHKKRKIPVTSHVIHKNSEINSDINNSFQPFSHIDPNNLYVLNNGSILGDEGVTGIERTFLSTAVVISSSCTVFEVVGYAFEFLTERLRASRFSALYYRDRLRWQKLYHKDKEYQRKLYEEIKASNNNPSQDLTTISSYFPNSIADTDMNNPYNYFNSLRKIIAQINPYRGAISVPESLEGIQVISSKINEIKYNAMNNEIIGSNIEDNDENKEALNTSLLSYLSPYKINYPKNSSSYIASSINFGSLPRNINQVTLTKLFDSLKNFKKAMEVAYKQQAKELILDEQLDKTESHYSEKDINDDIKFQKILLMYYNRLKVEKDKERLRLKKLTENKTSIAFKFYSNNLENDDDDDDDEINADEKSNISLESKDSKSKIEDKSKRKLSKLNKTASNNSTNSELNTDRKYSSIPNSQDLSIELDISASKMEKYFLWFDSLNRNEYKEFIKYLTSSNSNVSFNLEKNKNILENYSSIAEIFKTYALTPQDLNIPWFNETNIQEICNKNNKDKNEVEIENEIEEILESPLNNNFLSFKEIEKENIKEKQKIKEKNKEKKTFKEREIDRIHREKQTELNYHKNKELYTPTSWKDSKKFEIKIEKDDEVFYRQQCPLSRRILNRYVVNTTSNNSIMTPNDGSVTSIISDKKLSYDELNIDPDQFINNSNYFFHLLTDTMIYSSKKSTVNYKPRFMSVNGQSVDTEYAFPNVIEKKIISDKKRKIKEEKIKKKKEEEEKRLANVNNYMLIADSESDNSNEKCDKANEEKSINTELTDHLRELPKKEHKFRRVNPLEVRTDLNEDLTSYTRQNLISNAKILHKHHYQTTTINILDKLTTLEYKQQNQGQQSQFISDRRRKSLYSRNYQDDTNDERRDSVSEFDKSSSKKSIKSFNDDDESIMSGTLSHNQDDLTTAGSINTMNHHYSHNHSIISNQHPTYSNERYIQTKAPSKALQEFADYLASQEQKNNENNTNNNKKKNKNRVINRLGLNNNIENDPIKDVVNDLKSVYKENLKNELKIFEALTPIPKELSHNHILNSEKKKKRSDFISYYNQTYPFVENRPIINSTIDQTAAEIFGRNHCHQNEKKSFIKEEKNPVDLDLDLHEWQNITVNMLKKERDGEKKVFPNVSHTTVMNYYQNLHNHKLLCIEEDKNKNKKNKSDLHFPLNLFNSNSNLEDSDTKIEENKDTNVISYIEKHSSHDLSRKNIDEEFQVYPHQLRAIGSTKNKSSFLVSLSPKNENSHYDPPTYLELFKTQSGSRPSTSTSGIISRAKSPLNKSRPASKLESSR